MQPLVGTMLGVSSQHPPNQFLPLSLTLRPARATTHLLVSATAQPRRQLQASKQQQQFQKQEQQEKQSQLKGLDVLRAMQRAAAEKNRAKGKNKTKEALSKSSRREEEDVDYSNVRPLCVKSEWGVKLNDLEKRLQELTDTK